MSYDKSGWTSTLAYRWQYYKISYEGFKMIINCIGNTMVLIKIIKSIIFKRINVLKIIRIVLMELA